MSKFNAITPPTGFLFSTAEAAIKKPGRQDLALIFSEREAVVAGMFTTNKIKAAPVRLDMKKIKKGRGQAIVVNSGNANACTGVQGVKDAEETAGLLAESLKIDTGGVFVCSTGVIGTPMPMERVRPKIPELVKGLGRATVEDVAAAIMTTDLFPKAACRKLRIGTSEITLTGVAKGAGMICPNMATMLCFIITDAAIERASLKAALRESVENSFNSITVDGDMSTNDTVLVMANGMARNRVIVQDSAPFRTFASALSDVTYRLSTMIVKDGEGATKLVEIEVKNARTDGEARKAAFAIANSLLVKTAVYGNDANWGRIIAAIGYSGIAVKEENTDIYINDLKIVSRGSATGKDRQANERLRNKEVRISADLRLGKGKAKVLTCDLTEDYVKINAEYRT